eukprot:m.1203469 g.1203469  ORF g.1203469 m.1203469 type:complete len:731 (+) comp24579_c0_seq5:358-2550(+)
MRRMMSMRKKNLGSHPTSRESSLSGDEEHHYLDDDQRDVALVTAAKAGKVHIVTALLGAGARIDIRTKDGDTSLILAAHAGSVDTVDVLLKSGAKVDLCNDEGGTALMVASTAGHSACTRALLKASAAVDLQDPSGRTPLMRAASGGHIDTVRELLCGGAHVNARSKDQDTALIVAAYSGHATTATALIQAGANVDAENDNGDTALILASYKGHTAVVEALLVADARLDVQSKTGNTALMLATAYGHLDVVRLLLAYGADPDMQDKRGISALILAASAGNTDIVTALISGGARCSLRDSGGRRAIDWAEANEFPAVARAIRVCWATKTAGSVFRWVLVLVMCGIIFRLLVPHSSAAASAPSRSRQYSQAPPPHVPPPPPHMFVGAPSNGSLPAFGDHAECLFRCRCCAGVSPDDCLPCKPEKENALIQLKQCVRNCFNTTHRVENQRTLPPTSRLHITASAPSTDDEAMQMGDQNAVSDQLHVDECLQAHASGIPSDDTRVRISGRAVERFLHALGMDRHIARFTEEAITPSMIMYLTVSELRELGVNKMGERLLITRSAQQYHKVAQRHVVDLLPDFARWVPPDAGPVDFDTTKVAPVDGTVVDNLLPFEYETVTVGSDNRPAEHSQGIGCPEAKRRQFLAQMQTSSAHHALQQALDRVPVRTSPSYHRDCATAHAKLQELASAYHPTRVKQRFLPSCKQEDLRVSVYTRVLQYCVEYSILCGDPTIDV